MAAVSFLQSAALLLSPQDVQTLSLVLQAPESLQRAPRYEQCPRKRKTASVSGAEGLEQLGECLKRKMPHRI